MTSSRTEASAEAYLEALAVSSTLGLAGGTKAVMLLMIVQAAVQFDVQIGSWLDALNTQLTGGTPMLNALQSTYGQAQL